MSNLLLEIGNRLRKIRKNADMTQQHFADMLKISLNYYGNIERGKNRLSLENLLIIHKELGVDLTFLLTGEYNKNSALDAMLADFPNKKNKLAQLLTHLNELCK